MKIIEALHLAYDYIRTDENDKIIEKTRALNDVNISIEEGTFVCVLGHNGSGKSTLAKLINGLNLPSEGVMLVSSKDTKNEKDLWDIRKETGMVFQNPDNQIIASVVEEDVGFGPENIGVPTAEIWERVDKALRAVGMEAYRMKSPNRLSGGQKQRVAIAGTMAMIPKTIVLDEPTAMLDPSGRAEVIKTVRELNKTEGVTIILITHYMEETVDADRIIVMDQGNVVMDGTPVEVFKNVKELKDIRMDVPEVTELAWMLRNAGLPVKEAILTRKELVECLQNCLPKQVDFMPDFVKKKPVHMDITDPVIRVRNLSHVYQKGTAMESYALKDVSFDVQRGSIVGFIGHTGSGKSTLTQHLNGLLKATDGVIEVNFKDNAELIRSKGGKPVKPDKSGYNGGKLISELTSSMEMNPENSCYEGVNSSNNTSVYREKPLHNGDASKFVSIYTEGFDMKQLRFKVGLVFQYPEYQLFEIDVITDVMFGPKNQGLSEEEARKRAEEALKMVGLSEKLWKKSPFELSGGQKRRVAIAGVLAMHPEVLILDEPTAGLDPAGRDDLFKQIRQLHDKVGMTIILVSHSMDDVARYTDQVVVLDHGELKMTGTPEEIFKRYKELEEMGLGAPQMTYLIHELKDVGIRFEDRPDTVKEMADCIVDLWKRYNSENKKNKSLASGKGVN
ncbi:energy-coupling factor transporter ATPase [Oribacterium sp. WCC10]|uniref:energy-coupling factor transporter ATPase n=1 Tax=Oribacterium sp. WCC10 TaxID=1855343 RepID=UPI0008EA4B95|nr:energy-coupling factor transporter ATPase [Oribacterium sp. WCC10]SFG35866.1 energy-coupling factor transporter ATPase/energy-coupling factor transporter ATPase,TIGR04521 [Oribacterium sp. WCC10]